MYVYVRARARDMKQRPDARGRIKGNERFPWRNAFIYTALYLHAYTLCACALSASQDLIIVIIKARVYDCL